MTPEKYAHCLNIIVFCWRFSGNCCNVGYPSETHLKPNFREISFVHNLLLSSHLSAFPQSTAVIQPCLVQIFNKNSEKLTTASSVRDQRNFASLKWVSNKYPILLWYPPETHLKLKYREISFVHNIFSNCLIVLKFYTWHGSDIAVFCIKYQDGWIIDCCYGRTRLREIWVWDEFRTGIIYCNSPQIYLALVCHRCFPHTGVMFISMPAKQPWGK